MRAKGPPFATAIASIRRQAPTVLLFSLLANLLLLASSLYMMQVYDRVLASGSRDTLLWLTVLAFAAIATYSLIEQSRRRLLSAIATWLDGQLSAPVLRRVLDARLDGRESEASTADVAELRSFIAGDALQAFLDAPWMPVFLAVIWVLHPALGAVATAGAVVLFVLALANDRLTRAATKTARTAQRSVQLQAQQILEQGETARALGMAELLVERWRRRQAECHDQARDGEAVTVLLANLSRFLRLALQTGILGLAAYLVLEGAATSGAMIGASIILGRALTPVERALGAWRAFISARTAFRNLDELFATGRGEVDSLCLPPPRGHLAVEQLAYAPRQRPVLRRVDFTIRAGEACGIIGPSGAGKSSLCRAIVGACRPSAGTIRLDGADVTTWDKDRLGRHLGYLPQQVDMFAGTVAENIARLGPVDHDAVIAAAKLADVHEMVLRLPDGYDTEIGTRGERLSGGQRQRLGLARALYGDPALLVLDEPTANLDAEGDEALYRALAQVKERGATILIVAHQPAALGLVDKVLVLKDGAVLAFGERDTVMRSLTARRPATPIAAPPPPPAQAAE
ncbi:MAG: type I secretion system permease/ATPase [Solirubrobacterales bacterium]